MKKRFVSILLVAAMTASLAACGGSNGGDNSASATEKGGKTESASDGDHTYNPDLLRRRKCWRCIF